MTRDAEIGLLRDIESVQIRVVINGVAAGVFDVHRGTGAIANQHRAVKVTHQMRTGRHLHHRFIDAGIGVEAIDSSPLLALQIRDVHQRGAVRDPEFVGAAFALSMRFDFTHVAAVFIHHPHPRIDQVVRAFMAEGDGIVIERTIDRVAQPFFLFVDHAAFAGLQIDAQQAAAGAFVEEIVENLPVVKRRPVAFGNLDADQLGAISVGHPVP